MSSYNNLYSNKHTYQAELATIFESSFGILLLLSSPNMSVWTRVTLVVRFVVVVTFRTGFKSPHDTGSLQVIFQSCFISVSSKE